MNEHRNAKKLTEAQVRQIYEDERTYFQIGSEHGVGVDAVRRIKIREVWRHLDLGPPLTRIPTGGRLTDMQAREIYSAPGTYRAVAAEYGTSTATVCSIKTRRTWKRLHQP